MRYFRIFASAPLALRLALMSFLFNLAMETSNAFVPLYAQSLGASNLEVGFIATAWGITYFLSSLVFGRQSDIHGRLVFMRYGLGLSVVAYLSQIFATNSITLLAARGFVGLSLGITTAATMAYTYENQKQIGRFTSYGSLGWLFGALVAAALRNYGALFLVSAISSVLAFLVSLTFKEEPGNRIKVITSLMPLLKANRQVYFVFFIRQLGGYAIWAIFPLFLADIGASKLWIAMFDAINTAVQFIVMRLVEGFNPAKVLRAGLLINALVFALYGVANNYLQIIPVQIIMGVAWSCLFIGALSYLLRKNVERGTVSGLLYSSMYLSASLGPIIGGAVSEVWGFGAVMYVASTLSLGGFLSSRGLNTNEEARPRKV